MKVLKCRTCKKELTGKELVRAERHNIRLCAPCYREYYRQYNAKKRSDMPWCDDWILKEPLPMQEKKEREIFWGLYAL